MEKVFIIYDTKYGNTKLVAETIMEGIQEIEGIETAISDVKEVNLEDVVDSDAILIGSPNHMGGPVRGIKKSIDKLSKQNLRARWIAVFDTYTGGDFEKAVKKMERRINEKIPGLELVAPGLSIKVGGSKGPIIDGELLKSKEFGKKVGTRIVTRLYVAKKNWS